MAIGANFTRNALGERIKGFKVSFSRTTTIAAAEVWIIYKRILLAEDIYHY